MENKVSQIPEFKRYYLSEFELYNSEEFITFNIVGIDAAKNEIQIAVTNRGKISVITYDLLKDKNGRLLVGAAVGIGWFDSFAQAAETCVQIDSVSVPNPENTALYESLFGKYKAIHDALAPIYRGEL